MNDVGLNFWWKRWQALKRDMQNMFGNKKECEENFLLIQEEIKKLQKALDILRESNSFYAENYNPLDYDQGLTPYDLDEGKKARQAEEQVKKLLGESSEDNA